MASLGMKSLMRVDECKIGSVGALEAACTDVGSILEAEVTSSWDVEEATDAFYGDIPIEQERNNFRMSLSLTLEDIVDAQLALALGGEVVGEAIHFNASSTPAYKTIYLKGTEVGFGGTKKESQWHFLKFAPNAGQSLPLGKGQKRITLEGTCFVVPDAATSYKIAALTPVVADTAAPTVTVSPLDAATGVAVSANVVWTFNEAIRSEDVTARNFFVVKSDGTAVAGALSVNADNTVVTFDPTSNLTAAAAYVAVCNYVRDTAGNAIAAREVTNFTCA